MQVSTELENKSPLRDREIQYSEEYFLCAAPVADALDLLQGNETFKGTYCHSERNDKRFHVKFRILRKEWNMDYLLSVETRYQDFFILSDETSKQATLFYPKF